ncbi:hypothetical protein P9847_15605 [Paenibacillus chibensis]|uniref:DUF523 domain-containing protein n=1 Tax=Paenibacillus chibensis TaxID=59846 RepID=A0ABU6PV12_9BACL|nr:hypothetical protein [Paenibacillus chibensis]
MQSSRRIIVMSHCIINQNSVAPGKARSPGIMKSAVEWATEERYGILQLPCPELTFFGLDRPLMNVEAYDTPEYHAHNRRILLPVIDQLKTYQQHGYEIAGGLGIAGSLSCDPGRGVFMRDFLELAKEHDVYIDFFWQIPDHKEEIFDASDKQSVYGPVGRRPQTVSPRKSKDGRKKGRFR